MRKKWIFAFIAVLFACSNSVTGPTDEDIEALNIKVDNLTEKKPLFIKHVYSGLGDPFDVVKIDLPFDFEQHDYQITWWIKRNDDNWYSQGGEWFFVKDNRTIFSQCKNCATEWKCIIIDYGKSS